MFSHVVLILTLFHAPAWAEERPVILKDGGVIYAEARGWFGGSVLLRCRLDRTDRYSFGGTAIGHEENMTLVKVDHYPLACGPEFLKAARAEQQIFVDDKYVQEFEGLTEAGISCTGDCKSGSHLGGPAKIDPLAILGKSKFVNRAKPEKTDAELEAYIDCHATPGDKKNFDKYKALFKIAGDVFQVAYDAKASSPTKPILNAESYQNAENAPFMLKVDHKALACVAMRESRFDPTKVSNTGGKGLFQQVTDNVSEVDCLLNGCEAHPATPWAKPLWNKFFQRAKADPSLQALTINPVSKKPCGAGMTDKDRDAVCPLNGTAAAAINYMNALLSFKRNSDLYKNTEKKDFDEEDQLIMTILAAGTNNAGIGSLAKAVNKGRTPKQWLAELERTQTDPKRRKEVADFKRFMKNCLQHGNAESVWDDPTAKDCRKQIASAE